MVTGQNGLLTFHDSFGKSASIHKIEQDAFTNMQRTSSSNFGIKLDPNHSPDRTPQGHYEDQQKRLPPGKVEFDYKRIKLLQDSGEKKDIIERGSMISDEAS